MKPYLKMPELQFDHYKLRTIKLSDFKDMFDYGRDPEVTKYLSWGPFIFSVEAKRSIKEVFFARPKKGLPKGYAIVDMDNEKMIGTIDFHTKTMYGNSAEIGYVINRNYWNQGIMTKALALVVKVGFEHLKYDKIMIKHLKNNPASGRVIQNNHFTFIKSYPYVYQKATGVLESDLLEYELTREKYNELKSR